MNDTIKKFNNYLDYECGLSPNTIKTYLYNIEEFILKQNIKEVSQITSKSIVDFTKTLQVKQNSKYIKCVSIKIFCDWLFRENLVKEKILDLPIVQKESTPQSYLEKEEVTKIVSCIYGPNQLRDKLIITLLFHTGIRVSELCNIKIQNINLARREICINGKGLKQRIVPISYECADLLESYIKLNNNSLGASDKPLLINHTNSTQLSRHAITNMIYRYSIKSGLKPCTSHTLRRSFATNLLNQNVDLDFIKSMMGHSSIQSLDPYLKISLDRLKYIYNKYHPCGDKKYEKNN